MKKILKDIVLLTLAISYFVYSLTYSSYISKQITISFNLWLTRIIPSLFPTLIIIDLIYSTNIPYYINKYLHINIIYIISIISGSPSNAIMIKKCKNTDITKHLAITKYISFLYLYNNLKLLFSQNLLIILVVCNIIANIILIIILKPENCVYKREKISIISNIKEHMITLLSILGTIILINTLPFFLIKNIYSKLFILSFLEITTFFNTLITSSIALKYQLLFTIIAISTCGLCIEFQIKSIISDTSINYKNYLLYRMIHLIIYMLLIYLVITIL